MSAPTPNSGGEAHGHPTYIIFSGSGTIKESLGDYGIIFDTEVDSDTLHCMIVDPRFSTSDVEAYIVELGGEVCPPPPNDPPIYT